METGTALLFHEIQMLKMPFTWRHDHIDELLQVASYDVASS